MNTDWTKLVADLERLLKLRSIPFGMKLFEHREEMEAIPRIRRPKAVHTLDQIVAQAARLGWTVGLTSEDLVGRSVGRSSDSVRRKTINGVRASTWSGSGIAPRTTQPPIRRRWSACPTAATRRLPWPRSPAAG